jgi:DNA-binding beta-propeller fold protein YncE
VIALALLALTFAGSARPPAPGLSAAPIQDSPVLVRVVAHRGTRRLVCSIDGGRARTCSRRTRLKLAPGRHRIAAWAIGPRRRVSAKRRVTVVVPEPAPAGVAVGGEPVGIAAAGSDLWVSDGSTGSVVRVDAATRQVTGTISVGGQLGGIAATATAVWVSGFDSGKLARLDPAHGTVADRIDVGGQPTGVAFDATGAVWVGNLDGSATRIDPATDHATAHVPLPSGVSTLLLVGNVLWAGLQDGSLVSIDPAVPAVVGPPIPVSLDVDALASFPQGLWCSTFSGTADRIDPAARTVVKSVSLTGRGGGIAFGGGRVWVSAYDRAYAVELDPLTGALLGAVHTGAKPRDSVVAGQTLWVVDQAAGKLTPIPLAPRRR